MRSSRKKRRKSARGSTVQAMVSVTAVSVQFSSPNGVRRSWSRPGIFITMSTFSGLGSGFCSTNQRREISIGDVRQQVNRSAGRSGFIGSTSSAPHAARWIESRSGNCGSPVASIVIPSGLGIGGGSRPSANAALISSSARASARRRKFATMWPAALVSHT